MQGGVPAFAIVGLADRACQEAKERVRSGIGRRSSTGRHRIIVNLAPADLRKEGSGFDLPIALAVLEASAQIPSGWLAGHAAIGELALDGRLRPVPGSSSPPRGRAGAAPNGSSARQSPARRSRSPGSRRCRCGTSPRRSPTSAATSHCLAREGPDGATGRLRPLTSPTSAARSGLVGPRDRRGGRHNLLLAGPPGMGRRCCLAGFPGPCPASTTERHSRSRGSTPSPGCFRPARAWSAHRPSGPHTTRRPSQPSSGVARGPGRER